MTSSMTSSTTRMSHAFTAIAVFGLTSTSLASVIPTFASWTDRGNGSLDGVNFTVVKSGGGDVSGGFIGSGDFDDVQWGNAGNLSYLDYAVDNSFTITFDSAVSGLSLYTYYWRGANRFGGVQTLSEAFTANADFSGSTSGFNVDGTQYNSGILSFSGPVTTLTISGAVGNSSNQGLTFAQTAGSQAVPGIGGLAAIAGAGLVGRRRRR